MIISDEHGFVFVHIPKCGGTSVFHLLVGDKSRFMTDNQNMTAAEGA